MTTVAARNDLAVRPSRPTAAGAGGAAVLVAAGYVDPGNWGTDVAAGSAFGMRLAWVLVAAVAAAFVLQHLAARVGAATGSDLTRLVHAYLPRPVAFAVRPVTVTAVVLTDVVEVVGMVLGVRLVTGWSALAAGAATAVLVLLVVALPAGPGRRLVYLAMAGIALVYLMVAFRSGVMAQAGGLAPSPLPKEAVPVAIGLIGAIVMPHNILLHSSLGRDAGASPRRGTWMLAITLIVAVGVNLVIMALAAATPGSGSVEHGVGAVAPVVFGATLLAAGLASVVTTGLVGTDVTDALFRGVWAHPVARRLICLVPAVLVVAAPVSPVLVLTWSQIALAAALPFILVPLVWLASRRDVMGPALPPRWQRAVAAVVTGVIVLAALLGMAAS